MNMIDINNCITAIPASIVNNFSNYFLKNNDLGMTYHLGYNVVLYSYSLNRPKISYDEIKKENHELVDVLRENRELSKQLRESKNALEIKLITPKQFSEMFGIGIESQKQLRTRMKHPLPYIQINENGSIKYSIKMIEKWLENYKKNN